MSEIVKVQQPLFQTDAPALVYDRSRMRAMQMKLPDTVLMKMQDSTKAFFHATWTGKRWSIGERAPDQSW